MLRKSPRSAWKAGLLVAALITGTFATGTASAVIGEDTTGTTFAFSAKLDIGAGKRACSGALVDPYWVITAASCFTDTPSDLATVTAGAPKDKTTATIGRTDVTTTGGHVSDIVELAPRTDRDLVMARLATPATGITPITLSATAPTAGEELRVAGYGRTKTVWANDKLHTATFTVSTIATTGIDLATKTPTDAAICKGDTGGPTWRTVNGTPQLTAVNSRSWQGGCLGTPTTETRTGAHNTRVDDLGTWVQKTISATASGTVMMSSPGTIIDPIDRHVVTYVRDNESQLWSVDPLDEGWTNLGTFAATEPTVIVDPVSQHVIVYVNGPDNKVWRLDERAKTGWKEFDKTSSNTVMAPDAIPSTVVDPADGHMVTYIRDTANHLWSVDPQDEGWSDFGPMAAGDPFAVANPTTRHVVVYVNGPENKLWSVDQRGNHGWTPFDKTSSNTVMAPKASPFTVVDPADGHMVTYIRDTANHLWSVDPEGEGWYDFGPKAMSDPFAVVNPANQHVIVYVNGPDNRLFSADDRTKIWTEFIKTPTGTVLAPDAVPYTIVDPADGHLITYIRDTRNTLWAVDPQDEGWTKYHGGPSVP